MKNELTIEKVKNLSYPEFIGILGLENTANTFAVDYWMHNSKINKKFKVLEMAFSTGFNIRNCVLKIRAFGIGIDTSKESIESAKFKIQKDTIKNNIQFKFENAENLSLKKRLLEIQLTINENALYQKGKLQVWNLNKSFF
ncbi:MAG: hypothetical protein GDA46_07220 [Bdellovibrionales bacterium]|nr:hypothetical protein [Bdellovibrionales bacterium]